MCIRDSYWASRRCLMNREYQEAIRVLNILLRADPDAAEGYFLRPNSIPSLQKQFAVRR